MKSLIFAIVVFMSASTFADELKSIEATKIFSDEIMEKLVKNKFSEALNSTKPYWPLPAIEIDSLANQIDQQWPIIEKRFGKYTGKEFIKSKKIGSSFIRYYYLHKFENHAIYWQIGFYKSKEQWKINSITFLDSLEGLYE